MTPKEFNELVGSVQSHCTHVLREKEKQYGGDADRLVQFKMAGQLQGISPVAALSGMMAKHTTKLYMMMEEERADEAGWDEVIIDHINYLYLLKGVLADGKSGTR